MEILVLRRGINMPFAIYSKRTGIINRIIDDLDSLLPSEAMLEVDDEINYPRGFKSPIEGQDQNSSGFPLFDNAATAIPTIKPTRTVYDITDNRPSTAKNSPIYVTPTVPGGARKTAWVDIPITSHPFVWTVRDLAGLKYESILAQNYPYQVVIGEEYVDEDHIDTGNSSGYVLTEGKCMLQPGGVLQSKEFKFLVTSQGVVDPESDTSGEDSRTYIFDTYYLDVEPDPPFGIDVSWDGKTWSGDSWTTFRDAVLDEEMPTTLTGGSETTATLLRGIRLKFQNHTSEPFGIENFIMFLRIRRLPLV
jgi:hypothetical protein